VNFFNVTECGSGLFNGKGPVLSAGKRVHPSHHGKKNVYPGSLFSEVNPKIRGYFR
jgi:hypothetical protein